MWYIMIKYIITKNVNKQNTITYYIKIINDINNKYIDNNIQYTSWINSINLIFEMIIKDNTLKQNDKIKLYNFLKSIKSMLCG